MSLRGSVAFHIAANNSWDRSLSVPFGTFYGRDTSAPCRQQERSLPVLFQYTDVANRSLGAEQREHAMQEALVDGWPKLRRQHDPLYPMLAVDFTIRVGTTEIPSAYSQLVSVP